MRGADWQGFRIACVHKAAMVSTTRQVGIAYWRAIRFGFESMDKARIGAEFFWAAPKLSHVADDDSHAAMSGANDAANMNILIAIAREIAHVFTICLGADKGEMAVFVCGFRRADVEETRTVGKLNHIEDARRDADVFVWLFDGILYGQAGLSIEFASGRTGRSL